MAEWDEVLAFWFPEGLDADFETHRDYLTWCMRGGANAAIVERFSELTEAAARGELDDWADEQSGRLALIVVLDQFSRAVWEGDPRAYAQDPKSLKLSLEGLERGDLEGLASWERMFFLLPLAHCEGPDHLERIERLIVLSDEILALAPMHLKPIYAFGAEQPRRGREVIRRFGRHPHRNELLGRESTPEEAEYVRAGQFAHNREFNPREPSR